VARLFAQRDKHRAQPAPAPPPLTPQPGSAYALTALAREVDAVRAAVEGTRNDQLNRSAFNVGQLVAGGDLDRRQAWDALADAARDVGLEAREIDATLRSGFGGGAKHPRTTPPRGVDPVTGEIVAPQAAGGAQTPADADGDQDDDAAPDAHEDLSWAATGDIPDVEPPCWGARTDGHRLWYAGKVNGIFGDPEAAKTWIAMVSIREALDAGQRAVLVDVDHNGAVLTVQRLILLGASPAVLADPERFRYYAPDDNYDLAAAIAQACDFAPAVAVLDSLGELVPMMGGDSKDNDQITRALRLTAFRLADAGAAVITVDHLPKAGESRDSGYAIGGMAKKRAMNGTYIRAEVRHPPAPGAIGKVGLKVVKDRSGKVREHAPNGHIGTFVLDSTDPARSEARIDPPLPVGDTFRPTTLMEKVSAYLARIAPLGDSQRGIEDTVGGKAETLRQAVSVLHAEGYITSQKRQGRGGGVEYVHARPYAESIDGWGAE
jgi:hypothetical protein